MSVGEKRLTPNLIDSAQCRHLTTADCQRPTVNGGQPFELDAIVLSHMVYFTLKNPSEAACQELVDSCRRYLPGHDGIVFFAAGTHTPDLNRPVNDSDFHVTANVVFETREAHDAYQVSEKHQAFIAENKSTWDQIRVFDADVA